MKHVIAVVKRHKLLTLVLAPLVLTICVWVVFIPFLMVRQDLGGAGEIMGSVSLISFFLCLYMYPPVLTMANMYFMFKKNLSRFQRKINIITEVITIVAGILLSWAYISEMTNIILADWPRVLHNSEVHSPIATWTMPTVLTFMVLGMAGYLILRVVILDRLSPLITVLCIAAMYMGCILCILWTVQTFQTDRGGIFVYLFPVNCVLIAVKVICEVIRQWQVRQSALESAEEVPVSGKIGIQQLKRILRNSSHWPWLAFLFMIPLLGIVIMILTLFGQQPDSIIQAWTQTSQWTLSQKISPPNVPYDTHYLCTVAAGGHRKVVKPLRMGVRHGHQVVVNRQLCIANAFEQILEERLPHVHRRVRSFYDTYGYPVARHIRSKLAADVVYVMMKPLEWVFLAVIYLCDAKPENRIAMQYIAPLGSR